MDNSCAKTLRSMGEKNDNWCKKANFFICLGFLLLVALLILVAAILFSLNKNVFVFNLFVDIGEALSQLS